MKHITLKQFLLLEILFMVLLGGLHYLILINVLPPVYMGLKVFFIYVFLLILSLLGTWAIYAISRNDDSLLGKGFLVFTTIKILGSLVFLLPFILSKDESTKPFVYQFFAVFFPSLIVETMVILQLVKQAELKKPKKEENL
ncbi:MAG: hypothetical protein AB8B74_15165 [Crocinitomicaceae bacterium]